MQVLIVDGNVDRQSEMTMAFMRAGYQTTATGSQRVAETCLRRGVVDLLVISERVDRRLTHGLALLAEYLNPRVSTILLTDRTDADVDELFQLLPSLHCLLAPDVAPSVVTKLALASLLSVAAADRPMVLSQNMRVEDADAAPIFASRRLAPAMVDQALHVA